MKIQIEQSKLLEILDYLYVNGLFPFSIISTKEGKLFSAQADKEGFAFRYAVFLNDYFKTISKEEESVQIDIEKIKKFASLRKPDSIITLEYPVDNKLKISSENAKNSLSVPNVDDKDIKKGLPFQMKPLDANDPNSKKVPYIMKGTVPLDTHVSIGLTSFKTINDYAVAHGTEFFKFNIGKERELEVRIGDIHAMDDFTVYKPNCQIMNTGENLDVTFTRGIKELAKTFNRDVDIHLRSGMPAWFSEVSQSHKFGVLISPVKGA